jgi:hypothetical protein
MDLSDSSIEASEVALLTVDEAALVLRIGRSLAYQLATEYLATGGTGQGDCRNVRP